MPIILLCIRSSYKVNVQLTVAEIVYSSSLRLPGEFFWDYEPKFQQLNFLRLLKEHVKKLRPVAMSKHNAQNAFIYNELNNCQFVFLRQDFIHKALH